MAPFFEGRAAKIQDESQSDGRAAIQAMRGADTPTRPKVNAQGPTVGQGIRLFLDSTEDPTHGSPIRALHNDARYLSSRRSGRHP
jgi:hypothetical protein